MLQGLHSCANAGCRRTRIGRRPGPAHRPSACESSVRQRLECPVGAVEAIAKRGDPALLANIVPAMSDKKDIVRYSAAAAVLRLSRITQENGTQHIEGRR